MLYKHIQSDEHLLINLRQILNNKQPSLSENSRIGLTNLPIHKLNITNIELLNKIIIKEAQSNNSEVQ